jgi:hypothetical protein
MEIVEKNHDEEKKIDRRTRNNCEMIKGLIIPDIRKNLKTLFDLLDASSSKSRTDACDYLVDQIDIDQDIHASLVRLVDTTNIKAQAKEEGVKMIREYNGV